MIRDVFWKSEAGKEIFLEGKNKEFLKKKRESLIQKEGTFFDTEAFHQYHRVFADGVIRFHGITGESKLLGVMVLGEKDGMLQSAYASPFASMLLEKDFSSEEAMKMAEALRMYAQSEKKKLRLTLPPSCYDRRYAVKVGAFLDAGFVLEYAHVSNYLDLADLDNMEEFIAQRPHSFRKNIRRGEETGLQFEGGFFATGQVAKEQAATGQMATEQVATEQMAKDPVATGQTATGQMTKDQMIKHQVAKNQGAAALLYRAYEVIKKNREERGFPLSMSYQQICSIADLEGSHVQGFVVTLEEEDIAGAIVFGITPTCAQVIYWGNLSKGAGARPMEYLAVKLSAYYKERGFQILDIGPSTGEGSISHGLYRFKNAIGCRETLKFVLTYE